MNEEMVMERLGIPITSDRIHFTMEVPLLPGMKVVYATPEQWRQMNLRSIRENLSLRIRRGDRRVDLPEWGRCRMPHAQRKWKAQKAAFRHLMEKLGIDSWYERMYQ